VQYFTISLGNQLSATVCNGIQVLVAFVEISRRKHYRRKEEKIAL